MTLSSGGYEGKFTDGNWAMQAPFHGYGRYAVRNSSAWAVTADSSQARGISIAAGDGYGDGIVDSSSAAVKLQFSAAPTGQVRYGAVVMHRDWGTGTSSFQAVLGTTSSKIAPSTLTNTAGTASDQVIALVRVTAGSATVDDITDMRCWVEGARSIISVRTAQDSFAIPGNGQYAGISKLARAGEYNIDGIAATSGSGAFIGTLGLTANGVTLASELFSVGYGQRTEKIVDTFVHGGGVLTASLTGTFGGSVTGSADALPGSRLRVTWVGPTP